MYTPAVGDSVKLKLMEHYTKQFLTMMKKKFEDKFYKDRYFGCFDEQKQTTATLKMRLQRSYREEAWLDVANLAAILYWRKVTGPKKEKRDAEAKKANP